MAAVSGGLLLRPGDPRTVDFERDLSLDNPAWVQWQRHGKGYEPSRWVSPCFEMDDGPWVGGLIVPRFAPGVDGVDKMTLPSAPPLAFTGDLRPYQRAAVGAVLDQYAAAEARRDPSGCGAMVEAPCGAGKTVIGCAVMAEVASPALVLVHTRDLAAQWAERIKQYLQIDPTIVGYGKSGDGSGARIVVASLQTLARWGWWRTHQWAAQWGIVVLDECHHVPARTFCQVVGGLPGRVRLGLTATPERADGLTPWLGHLVGPTATRIDPQAIEKVGAVLAPRIKILRVPGPELDGLEAHERDRAVAEDEHRNDAIRSEVGKAVRDGRRVLILVRLVEHAHQMAEELCADGLVAHALTGGLAKRERASIIDRMRAGTVEVVVATSLADEGLDAPRLDTAVLAQPCGDLGKVEQRIGRVCRPHHEALPPLVVDVVDSWGPFQGYARRRAKLYRERGWEVQA